MANPYFYEIIQDALRDLGNNGNDYEGFLKAWSKGKTSQSGKVDGNLANDIQGKMLDQILAFAALKEQRGYDNPSAQLQRLMQTGMSRDAALQMINGSGGSGGSGGSPLIGASAPLVPSESALRGAQRAEAISNIVNTSLNTLANLANVGAQIPIYMQTAQGMAYQNQVQEQIMSAQEQMNQSYGIIQQALNDGVVEGDLKEFVGNRSNTEKAIEGLAKKGFQPAIDFINNDGLKSLRDNAYSAGVAEQMYYNLARPEQYMSESFLANRAQKVATELANANIQDVFASVEERLAHVENLIHDNMLKDSETFLNQFNLNRGQQLMPYEIKQAKANIGFTRSQIRLNNTQSNLNIATTGLRKAETKYTLGQAAYVVTMNNLAKEQVTAQQMQNKLNKMMLFTPVEMPDGTVTTGASSYSRDAMFRVWESTREMAEVFGNKDWYKHRVQSFLKDTETTYNYSLMRNLYSGEMNRRYQFEGSNANAGENLRALHWMNWFYDFSPYPQGANMSVPFMGNQQNSIEVNDLLRTGAGLMFHVKF